MGRKPTTRKEQTILVQGGKCKRSSQTRRKFPIRNESRPYTNDLIDPIDKRGGFSEKARFRIAYPLNVPGDCADEIRKTITKVRAGGDSSVNRENQRLLVLQFNPVVTSRSGTAGQFSDRSETSQERRLVRLPWIEGPPV
jgi:hypothetical protein